MFKLKRFAQDALFEQQLMGESPNGRVHHPDLATGWQNQPHAANRVLLNTMTSKNTIARPKIRLFDKLIVLPPL
ncbi:MAG: hypothetical protein K8S97_04660 [Anaerolineae bacterium]|nr:hypothetical protein [Anaerolineae bacterium]